eukprot:Rhum_TRINITY_DN771_c0_g1::Rhum_TRINITY_DN771_c0_g1_i1::g.2347::m.2347
MVRSKLPPRSLFFAALVTAVLIGHFAAVMWFSGRKGARVQQMQQQIRTAYRDALRGATAGSAVGGGSSGSGGSESASGGSTSGNLDLYAYRTARGVTIGGKQMAVVGYGTAGLGPSTKAAVLAALQEGYTHIDTAMAREWYRDDMVGEAIAESGVDRERLFLTTKLHPRDHGATSAARQVPQALKALQTSYVDLFLLHYSRCFGTLCGGQKPEGTWRDSWRVLEAAHRAGTVRALGVSNFAVSELKELLAFAEVKPAVVQTHSDPLSPNRDVQNFCKEHGIQFVAYSSLGTQHAMRLHTNPVLTNPAIVELAAKYSVSPAVVVLSWALHHGQVVIPRSRNPVHMKQNRRAGDLIMLESEYTVIDQLRL